MYKVLLEKQFKCPLNQYIDYSYAHNVNSRVDFNVLQFKWNQNQTHIFRLQRIYKLIFHVQNKTSLLVIHFIYANHYLLKTKLHNLSIPAFNA